MNFLYDMRNRARYVLLRIGEAHLELLNNAETKFVEELKGDDRLDAEYLKGQTDIINDFLEYLEEEIGKQMEEFRIAEISKEGMADVL